MSLKELKEGQNFENLRGKVIKKGEEKISKRKGIKVCEYKIEDLEENKAKMTLFEDQIERLSEGDKFKAESAYVKRYGGELEVRVGEEIKILSEVHKLGGGIDGLFLDSEGFEKGRWVLLYGEAGTGKSVVAAQTAIIQASEGERVSYISTEEAEEQFKSALGGLEKKLNGKFFSFQNIFKEEKNILKNKKVILKKIIEGELAKNDLVIIDNLSDLLLPQEKGGEFVNEIKMRKFEYPETSLLTTSYLTGSGATAGSRYLKNAADIVFKLEKKTMRYSKYGLKKGEMLRTLICEKCRRNPIDSRERKFVIDEGSVEVKGPLSKYVEE